MVSSHPDQTAHLPSSNEVCQLRSVRCNFDGDHLKVEMLLLSMDGVRPCRYVL